MCGDTQYGFPTLFPDHFGKIIKLFYGRSYCYYMDTAVACRAEDGNIKYDYYFATEDSDELLLIEKWRDADALARHGRQPHYARLGELKAEFVNDTTIEKYVSEKM